METKFLSGTNILKSCVEHIGLTDCPNELAWTWKGDNIVYEASKGYEAL
jgi:hypothetical protein